MVESRDGMTMLMREQTCGNRWLTDRKRCVMFRVELAMTIFTKIKQREQKFLRGIRVQQVLSMRDSTKTCTQTTSLTLNVNRTEPRSKAELPVGGQMDKDQAVTTRLDASTQHELNLSASSTSTEQVDSPCFGRTRHAMMRIFSTMRTTYTYNTYCKS